MRLLQLKQTGLGYLNGMPYLLVESQNYGQPTQFVYHIVVNNATAEVLLKHEEIREIKDTGRTIGFWQNLAGHGVLAPHLVATRGFDQNVTNIISRCKPANLSVAGKTWKAIISSMRFTDIALEAMGIGEKVVKAKIRKSKAETK